MANSLKLVPEFQYPGSYISFTKTNVNLHTGNAWTAIGILSTIQKFDFSDKTGIFPSYSHVCTTEWLHHLNA